MEIRQLVWRSGNLDKLAAHGITQDDVLEVIELDRWVVHGHPDYPDQVRITGPTRGGHLITVVLDPEGAPDRWRPVTGWRANTEEREYYWEERR
jgi:hypothetical protein